MELSDSVLLHLRRMVDLPDLSGTRFELEGEIGRGGMGVVYAARDRDLGRRVALKVMDAALSGEPLLIARLEHPAIVPVYEAGTLPDGRVFYAMKLVSGARLDRHLETNPPLGERLRIVQRVAEALGFAHSQGVPHRDLKPQNVMVGAFGEVYVMDWGVEGVAGTPAFRAPEGAVDSRSDIYALGALLGFVLSPVGQVSDLPSAAFCASGTRRTAFGRGQAGNLPHVPAALVAIAAKAMNADPAARYPDAAAVLAEIARFQEGLAVEAFHESPWQTVRRYAGRNAVLLWLLAAYVGARFFLFFIRGR